MHLIRIMVDTICFMVPLGLCFLFMINRQKSKTRICAQLLFISGALVFLGFFFNDLHWRTFSLVFNLLYPFALTLIPVLYLLFLYFFSVRDAKMDARWFLIFLFPVTAFFLYNHAFYFHYPFPEIRDHFYEITGNRVIPERFKVISAARNLLLVMETCGLIIAMAGQVFFVRFLLHKNYRKKDLDQLLHVIATAICMTSGTLVYFFAHDSLVLVECIWITGILLLGIFMYRLTGYLARTSSIAAPEISLKPGNLLQYFEEQHPWRNPDLRLPEVIKGLHTNRTYLSQVLKKDLHTNYTDFVNKYRVEEAKQLMNQSGEQLKLYYISELCGFKHYATFSEVFHKKTGQTPSEYLQTKGVKRI